MLRFVQQCFWGIIWNYHIKSFITFGTFPFFVLFVFHILTPYVLHLFQQCMPSNKHISNKNAILKYRGRPLAVYNTGVQVYSMDSRSATGKLWSHSCAISASLGIMEWKTAQIKIDPKQKPLFDQLIWRAKRCSVLPQWSPMLVAASCQHKAVGWWWVGFDLF